MGGSIGPIAGGLLMQQKQLPYQGHVNRNRSYGPHCADNPHPELKLSARVMSPSATRAAAFGHSMSHQ